MEYLSIQSVEFTCPAFNKELQYVPLLCQRLILSGTISLENKPHVSSGSEGWSSISMDETGYQRYKCSLHRLWTKSYVFNSIPSPFIVPNNSVSQILVGFYEGIRFLLCGTLLSSPSTQDSNFSILLNQLPHTVGFPFSRIVRLPVFNQFLFLSFWIL